ncbi:autotransporter outer membrane beta-barrel domain-containing protein, partial [Pandoraea sp. CB10b_02]|uniref:autotransporter outer membrane beta-barrel domain-containing protein n=1 Tax=Pandoraea sp. CB10b_02 TaxID=2014535 RepID=UPI00257CE49B
DQVGSLVKQLKAERDLSDTRRIKSAELNNKMVKLSATDQKLALAAIERGEISDAEQLTEALPTIRAKNARAILNAIKRLPVSDQAIAWDRVLLGSITTSDQVGSLVKQLKAERDLSDTRRIKSAELNNKMVKALASLSSAHRKLVRDALENGQIDVDQAIASANKLALDEAFDSLPEAVKKELLTQYASGQFADPAALAMQAAQVQAHLLDQDRRGALTLPQMAFAAEQNAARLQQGMRDRLAGDSAFMQGGAQSDITDSRKNVWAQASGDQSNATGSAGALGFSMRGAGVSVGADTTFGNNRVGIALGYANSTIDASGKHAKSKVDTFSVGLYGSHSINDWFANAGVSYSGHSIKSDRNAVVGGTSYGMSAKTHGDTVGGFVEFGKKIETSLVNITPSVTARVNETSIKGFTENGVASVTADKSEYLSARVGFGVRLWKDFGDESHHITPSLRIAYERDVADSAPSMNVVLHGINGLAPMRTNLSGLKLGRNIVSAQAGVTMQLSKRLSANAAINSSWRQHETQVGASGSIVYHW